MDQRLPERQGKRKDALGKRVLWIEKAVKGFD